MQLFIDHARKNSPQVSADRCLNARHSSSDCRYCESICPAKALHVSRSHISLDESRCIGCGLCLGDCPIEAFSSEGAPSELPLDRSKCGADGSLAIACSLHADAVDAPSTLLVSTCLASFQPSALFEAALHGNLTIVTSKCDQCHCKTGYAIIRKKAELVTSWLGSIGSSFRVDASCSAPKPPDPECGTTCFKKSKRAATAAGFARRESRLYAILTSYEASETPVVKQETMTRRQLTGQRAITWRTHLASLWPTDHPGAAPALWPHVAINASACTACGTCRQYCPTGALRHTCEDERFRVEFTPGMCADCGLCALACPGGNLERTYERTTMPFEPHPVMQAPQRICERCGSITVSDEGLCAWCHGEPALDNVLEAAKQELFR